MILQRWIPPSLFLILLLILFVSMGGVDEALANLIEKPNEPDSLWVTERKNTSVRLNWSGGPGFGWQIIGFQVNYRKKGTTTWNQEPTDSNNLIPGTYTTISNQQHSTTLEWRVRIWAKDIANSKRWSDWSSVAEATTNRPPQKVGTIPNQTFNVGHHSVTIDVSVYFSDPDGQTLTYTENSDRTSLSGSTLTITPGNTGVTATVGVTASDVHSLSATQSFTLTVVAPPPPVTVGTIPDQTVAVGGAATVDVSSYFSDPQGLALVYSATSSDTSIATVSLSGKTLTITPVAEGSATLTVTATNNVYDSNATATQTFSVTIITNRAPVTVGTIPDQTVAVGGAAATVDVSPYFSDPDGNPLTYVAGSSDTSIATVSRSESTFTITPVAAGTATITVQASDDSNASVQQTFSVNVVANRSPTRVGTIPTQSVRVGGTDVTLDVSSYFSDPDGNTLTYSATSSNTSIATVSTSDATVTITAVAAGTATISVRATDPGNASTTQNFSVTVKPSNIPVPVGTMPAQTLSLSGTTTATLDASSYFSVPSGDTLTYSATSSDTGKATVSLSGATLTTTGVAAGSATITVTVTNTSNNATATQTFSVTVVTNLAPTTVGTIPDNNNLPNGIGIHQVYASNYFSDPDGNALTYSASSSDDTLVETNVGGVGNSTVYAFAYGLGTVTVTVTATDPSNATATQTFSVTVVAQQADVVPGLSTTEQLLLGKLLTYNTLIFNELHNSSDNANDWLELRNVSSIDIPLDNWQLTVQTGSGAAVISFPAGTVIPTGEVLLITNTAWEVASWRSLLQEEDETATSAVVVESFALPQTEFALILRSPTAFGDLAGNYFQDASKRPETAPELTLDTVWERVQATTSGYRAEAWAVSTHRNGLGSPGYQPSALVGDLNHDGVVNILDLVLVASQFGATGITAADLNGDNTVNIQDLVLIANASRNVSAAPTAKQSAAAVVNTWLQLARQDAASTVQTSLPKGFSYARGIQVLEHLARALTPDTTALLANYPNPFNPETWIPYQLSKPADVTVTIYAATGSVVRTLALGHQAAGMYKNRAQAAYWDGRNELGETVASGVYFYTLTAGDFSATRKMLIRK